MTITGIYKPSGFATLERRGKFAVDDMKTVVIDDGGQHPETGGRAWLCEYGRRAEIRGAVTAWHGHCDGTVTVTCEFPEPISQ